MQKVIPGSPVRIVKTATETDNTKIKKTNIFARIINKIKRVLRDKKV